MRPISNGKLLGLQGAVVHNHSVRPSQRKLVKFFHSSLLPEGFVVGEVFDFVESLCLRKLCMYEDIYVNFPSIKSRNEKEEFFCIVHLRFILFSP